MSEEEIKNELENYSLLYEYREGQTYPHHVHNQDNTSTFNFDTYAEIEAFISGLEYMRLTHRL